MLVTTERCAKSGVDLLRDSSVDVIFKPPINVEPAAGEDNRGGGDRECEESLDCSFLPSDQRAFGEVLRRIEVDPHHRHSRNRIQCAPVFDAPAKAEIDCVASFVELDGQIRGRRRGHEKLLLHPGIAPSDEGADLDLSGHCSSEEFAEECGGQLETRSLV